jgi:hypothetical protein
LEGKVLLEQGVPLSGALLFPLVILFDESLHSNELFRLIFQQV